MPEPWTWYFCKRGNHLSSFEPRKPFAIWLGAGKCRNDLFEEEPSLFFYSVMGSFVAPNLWSFVRQLHMNNFTTYLNSQYRWPWVLMSVSTERGILRLQWQMHNPRWLTLVVARAWAMPETSLKVQKIIKAEHSWYGQYRTHWVSQQSSLSPSQLFVKFTSNVYRDETIRGSLQIPLADKFLKRGNTQLECRPRSKGWWLPTH